MAEINKILCAVDFSEHSPRVADYAAELARGFGAEVLCLYVAPSLSEYLGFHVPPSSIENFVGEIVAGADTTMEDFVAKRFEGVPCTGKVLTGYAAEEILAAITNEKADLLVMGTHGRKGIDRILFGSVAEKVVKAATCPVLTIRPLPTGK
ncbi:universal stress protein [Desulfolutivibrio sulfoxidireducens]|uniref:universal stress protein n=1 Tax=Desulfolutivibrio sulfoxidireducens TaxID=2773299 RepID=UPI00159E8474|nr:universal stress protein [Desulfolutivibrio sulfoxidireducens]QLA15041.1 universal stress protein [Desulfolutivibrio sulfoxidireducens]